MASYSEAFLNSLSRASSSISGLMAQVREPSFEEKTEIETNASKELMQTQAETTAELQSFIMGEKHTYDTDLASMGYENNYNIEAIRAMNALNLQGLRGEQAMDQIRYETAQKLEDAGYDAMVALGQTNFVGVSDPSENQGFTFETAKRFLTKDNKRAEASKQQFETQYNLLNVGLADVLQVKQLNPNAPSVTQAIDLINTGIETAESLATFSARQSFDEDQDYYNNRLEQMYQLKATLEQ
jgi:hypothetical protein